MLISNSITVILSSSSWFITLGGDYHTRLPFTVPQLLLYTFCPTGCQSCLLPRLTLPGFDSWARLAALVLSPLFVGHFATQSCLCLWVLGSLVSPFYLISHLIYKVRGQRSNLAKALAKSPDPFIPPTPPLFAPRSLPRFHWLVFVALWA